ncbi:MAG TPA: hypothetical protein VGO62_04145 [Myxococcota bacterium]
MVLVAIAGCGGLTALPPDKQDYAGFWVGPTISLTIGQDAEVEYARDSAGGSTSISGQIERFDGDNFVVYAVMNFSFKVTAPPHVDARDGLTHMSINGEDVNK